MNKPPTVSVIIPALNAAEWIGETLHSILTQSFQELEVIVVDGGSTDDTPSIIKTFGKSVKLICKPLSGKSASRNAGIYAAQGDYIAFIDADDLWLPEKLELQMQMFSRNPALGWVYSDGYLFEGASTKNIMTFGGLSHLYSGDILCPLLLIDFIPSPTPVIRRKIFDEVGYFDETLLRQEPEDWDMWLRIAAHYPIGFVNRPLVRYRLHRYSLMAREGVLAALEGKISIIERAVKRNPDRLNRLKDRSIANSHVAAGNCFALSGELSKARLMYLHAIKLAPMSSKAYVHFLFSVIGKPMINKIVKLRRWSRYKRAISINGWRSL
jgi:glycosyltransferase involved in cell wall biosynthesis